MGASLVSHGHLSDLYDYGTQLNWWRAHEGSARPLVPYVRPPFYAAMQSAIAKWPPRTAFIIDVSSLSLILIACWFWFARSLGAYALVLAALFWPAALGIAFGQDCVLMLGLLAISYHLHQKGHDGWSGAVLALALYKYHLLLLIGPCMLLGRRSKMFAGFAATAAAEALSSLVLAGPQGLAAYVSLLFRKDLAGLYPSPQLMPNLNGLLLNFHVASAPALIAASAAILVCALISAWNAPWWRGMTSGIAASILIVPHVFGYDVTVLMLSLLLVVKLAETRLARVLAMWLCTPLVYLGNLFSSPWPALLPIALALLVLALCGEALRNWHPAHGSRRTERFAWQE